MLSWPSSQRIRYRGEGSPRKTSSTTPERGRRSVDSDSATTRWPTAKAMLTPSSFVLTEDSRRQPSGTTTSARFSPPNIARTCWPPRSETGCSTPLHRPRAGLAVARRRVLVLVDRGSLLAQASRGRVACGRSLTKPHELIVSPFRPDWPPPQKRSLAGPRGSRTVRPMTGA